MLNKLLLAIAVFFTTHVYSQLAISIPNDFENSESLMLVWAYNAEIDSIEAEIVSKSKEHADIIIIYNPNVTNFDTVNIRGFLQSLNADSTNVSFMEAVTNTPLLAQYAPVIGYGVFADTMERYFGDPRFEKYSRPFDDSLSKQIKGEFGWNNVDYALQFEGNNVIYDGLRHMFVGDRILDENPLLTQNEIQFDLYGYYNSGICTFLPNPEMSGGGELASLNSYVRLTDFETVIVSSVPDTLPDHIVLNSIADEISGKQTYFGDPFEVHRITMAPGPDNIYPTDNEGENRSYTNSIIINDLVIIPSFGNEDLDQEAFEKYVELFPGYTIKTIESTVLSANHSGLHTLTRVIPNEHLLRILHKKVTGLQPYNPFVKINCLCETDNFLEQMWLYYKVNQDTAYTVEPIQLVCPQHFATIDKLNPGDTVSYYIEAISANATTTYPLSAPEGNFTFWLDMSTGGFTNSVFDIQIAPNPGNGVFRIISKTIDALDMKIYNSLGQLVMSRKVRPNAYIDLTQDLKSGHYTFVISSPEGISTKTYIVQ